MSNYQISSEIPAPTPRKQRSYAKYPWHEMKVGESILVDADHQASARNAAAHHGKAHGRMFVTRMEGDCRRIWRVA